MARKLTCHQATNNTININTIIIDLAHNDPTPVDTTILEVAEGLPTFNETTTHRVSTIQDNPKSSHRRHAGKEPTPEELPINPTKLVELQARQAHQKGTIRDVQITFNALFHMFEEFIGCQIPLSP